MDDLKYWSCKEIQILKENINSSDKILSSLIDKDIASIHRMKRRVKKFNKKEKPKFGKQNKRSTTMQCSSCLKYREISVEERYRVAKAKCFHCGGPMNRMKDIK